MCERVLPIADFSAYEHRTSDGKIGLRYESRCRPCNRARRRERYAKKGAEDRATSNAWKARNREHLQAYNRKKQKDPAHRAIKAKSQRLRKARIRSGQPDDPAIRAIYGEAMRVEALIQSCPVFDLPELGKKIHVDHIIPLSKGGQHVASNLQLLPIGLNMRKGTSCPK